MGYHELTTLCACTEGIREWLNHRLSILTPVYLPYNDSNSMIVPSVDFLTHDVKIETIVVLRGPGIMMCIMTIDGV